MFNEVLIIFVILLISSVKDIKDILCLLDKINGLINMNVIELVISIKNVIIRYLKILWGFMMFELVCDLILDEWGVWFGCDNLFFFGRYINIKILINIFIIIMNKNVNCYFI